MLGKSLVAQESWVSMTLSRVAGDQAERLYDEPGYCFSELPVTRVLLENLLCHERHPAASLLNSDKHVPQPGQYPSSMGKESCAHNYTVPLTEQTENFMNTVRIVFMVIAAGSSDRQPMT